MRFCTMIAMVSLLILAGGIRDALAAPVLPGDLFYMTTQADGNNDKLIRVDPATGAETVISQGGWHVPRDSAWADGKLLIVDQDAGDDQRGAIYRVDPITGARTVLSSGGSFNNPVAIALASDGTIYTCDLGASFFGIAPSIIRVNPVTGAQQVVAQGSAFEEPWGLSVEPGGTLLVSDQVAGIPRISRVNPATGYVQVLSQAGLLSDPRAIAVDGTGQIYVADPQAGVSFFGAILQIDPLTGAQTIVSQGEPFHDPHDLNFDLSGQVIVADASGGSSGVNGCLFRVDPLTGTRSRIVDAVSQDIAMTVTVVPIPEPHGVAISLAGAMTAARRRRRRGTETLTSTIHRPLSSRQRAELGNAFSRSSKRFARGAEPPAWSPKSFERRTKSFARRLSIL
jgi:sugar lactone lactonase YvrE